MAGVFCGLRCPWLPPPRTFTLSAGNARAGSVGLDRREPNTGGAGARNETPALLIFRLALLSLHRDATNPLLGLLLARDPHDQETMPAPGFGSIRVQALRQREGAQNTPIALGISSVQRLFVLLLGSDLQHPAANRHLEVFGVQPWDLEPQNQLVIRLVDVQRRPAKGPRAGSAQRPLVMVQGLGKESVEQAVDVVSQGHDLLRLDWLRPPRHDVL